MSNQKNLYPNASEVANVLKNCVAIAKQNTAHANSILKKKIITGLPTLAI